jgi:predicted GNAT family acetyltransferase
MNGEQPAVDVRHNAEASRFEANVDGLLSVASYHLDDGVMRMYHTAVPPALEGRGVAVALVDAALAYAAAQGLKVEPGCSYVRAYMRRHPETHALLAAGVCL